jgi:ribosome biogenesis GTPase
LSELVHLGWHPFFEASLAGIDHDNPVPGRVAAAQRELFVLWTAHGEVSARIAGRLRHRAASADALPAVGDWVAAGLSEGEGPAIIHAVLPRRSALVRKAAGRETAAQVLATNLDSVMLITSCTEEFNPRRIERALALMWDSGAQPVLLVNKTDLVPGAGAYREAAEAVAIGVPVQMISALTGAGLDALGPYVAPGRTTALIGSSGVGKSTLTNRLAGRDLQAVRAVREDDARGRHATSARQMIRLPSGGLLIDTPGMREVGLWEDAEGIADAFPEIDALAERCRFRDCRHESEPGCAVKFALESGEIEDGRYESYLKLRREVAYMARRQDYRLRADEKRRWKQIAQMMRERKRR